MAKKEYVYFLVHEAGASTPLSFFGNRKEALKALKLYGGSLFKREIESKRGVNEVRKSGERSRG